MYALCERWSGELSAVSLSFSPAAGMWTPPPPLFSRPSEKRGKWVDSNPEARGVYPERTSTSNRKPWTPGRLFNLEIHALTLRKWRMRRSKLAEREKKREVRRGAK